MLVGRQKGRVCEGGRAVDIRTCGNLGLEQQGRDRFELSGLGRGRRSGLLLWGDEGEVEPW